jgi:hypothetical protein
VYVFTRPTLLRPLAPPAVNRVCRGAQHCTARRGALQAGEWRHDARRTDGHAGEEGTGRGWSTCAAQAALPACPPPLGSISSTSCPSTKIHGLLKIIS